MKQFLFLAVIFSTFLKFCACQGGECPEGWSKLKDEKCYLLISSYSTYSGAKETCAGRGATLTLIKEQEQQDFLTNFIFNVSNVEIGVWIGATRIPDSQTDFQWEDQTPVEYSNWDVDSPSDVIGRDCVIMQSRFSKLNNKENGKWEDVSCNTANYFVCEKVPSWSLDDIRRVLIETRKALENTVENLASTSQKLTETEGKLNIAVGTLDNTVRELDDTKVKLATETQKVEGLQNNPVPIGFIYIEYHGQPAPQSLWPGVTWTDVTASYAGLFFRALGGGSAEFGSIQEGDAPRLTHIQGVDDYGAGGVQEIIPGVWSVQLYSGQNAGRVPFSHKFLVSAAEIRPRNAGVRIWRREA